MMLLLVMLPALCPGSARGEVLTSRDGSFEVRASPQVAELRINHMHAWALEVTDAEGAPVTGARITVEGGMPAHDHGLPTRPRVRELAEPGHYLLEGLRFHMPGEWLLSLRIETERARDVVRWSLQL